MALKFFDRVGQLGYYHVETDPDTGEVTETITFTPVGTEDLRLDGFTKFADAGIELGDSFDIVAEFVDESGNTEWVAGEVELDSEGSIVFWEAEEGPSDPVWYPEEGKLLRVFAAITSKHLNEIITALEL